MTGILEVLTEVYGTNAASQAISDHQEHADLKAADLRSLIVKVRRFIDYNKRVSKEVAMYLAIALVVRDMSHNHRNEIARTMLGKTFTDALARMEKEPDVTIEHSEAILAELQAAASTVHSADMLGSGGSSRRAHLALWLSSGSHLALIWLIWLI